MNQIIVDVRERDEFNSEYIPGSINLPLSTLAHEGHRSFPENALLICQSGKRAALAQLELQQRGIVQTEVFPGGLNAWINQGKKTAGKRKPFPIMRQVQMIAGTLMLMSSLLSVFYHAHFAWIGAFVGLGLSVAGLTGFCGMALLLAKAPWNRAKLN